MPVAFSLYLDFLRVFAALLVFISHLPFTAAVDRFTATKNTGYDAVVIFFVLSGYVIAYAAERVEKNWVTYAASRIARIMPVALVAILLALILEYLLHDRAPAQYEASYQLAHVLRYFAVNAVFAGQLWWLDIKPFDNGPYWSLDYEVWDYVLFGCAFFAKGRRRVIAVLAVLLVTGPKFWFLLPVWLAGVAAYRCRDRWPTSRVVTLALFVGPLPAYVLFKLLLPADWSYMLVGRHVEGMFHHGLDGAAGFFWAYILALMTAAHIFAARRIGWPGWTQRPAVAHAIRILASYTFSLYLFHYPFRYAWVALVGPPVYAPGFIIARYLFILIPVAALAHLTEHRKTWVRAKLLAAWRNQPLRLLLQMLPHKR